MYFTGFTDEAGKDIDTQIRATLELGWKNIESRNIDGTNIHNISDEQFEYVIEKLDGSGVKINCFGSEIANWSKDPLSDDEFEKSKQELKRALPRMEKLGTKMLRAMSFARFKNYSDLTPEIEKRIFSQVGYLVKMCEDAGVMYLHENCMNYGGMSWQHTLKLLDNIKSDSFRLVFDTGNPPFTYDCSKTEPFPKQKSWEFYDNVKEFIYYVHIKDAVYKHETDGVFPAADFKYPGEGDGDVLKIVTDLIKNGYDGGFSIEPHMEVVFHEETSQEDKAQTQYDTYIEYGRRFEKIINDLKS